LLRKKKKKKKAHAAMLVLRVMLGYPIDTAVFLMSANVETFGDGMRSETSGG